MLILSVEHRNKRTGFEPIWGYGVLNARQALELVRQGLPSPAEM
jgi:hypothetical protein